MQGLCVNALLWILTAVSQPWIIYAPSWTHSEMSFYSPIQAGSEMGDPRLTPADISAFCTFLQGSSRHRLSLSQISQALTAAVRWLHYVPIWLVFAMTHLLTPTSLIRPPTTIDSSDKTDGDDDKWTLRGRWYGCIQMSAHSPVTVKHVWRCHPALSHGCTALLWEWLLHLNAVRTVMRVSLSQTCNYCIMLYSCQNRLQRARKTPWGAKLQTQCIKSK